MNNLASVLKPLIVCNSLETHPDCHWADLVQLANNIVQDLIVISTILATISIIFAGIKLLTSQGNPGAMQEAKGILLKIVIGYLVILIAWLVVYTITNAFLGSDYSILSAP